MKKGTVLKSAFDIYTIIRQLGNGGAGTVYEVEDSDGKSLALKVLNSGNVTNTKLKRFKNEIYFCQREISAHVVRVLDYGTSDGGKFPFYVMPFYGGTLRTLIKAGIAATAVLQVFNQVLDGVEAAHLLGVCHRDIKPENVLHDLVSNTLVVADFGIAQFQEEHLQTAVNTGPQERLA